MEIERTMVVNDVIQRHPSAVTVMEKYGFHCSGCGFNTLETIEEGAMGHGMTGEQLELLLKDLNDMAADEHSKPVTSDTNGAEITVTADAATKIKEIMDKNNINAEQGMRIRVSPGGCAGLSYDIAFDEEKDGDNVFPAGQAKVLVDKDSMEFLKGSKVNYIETLQKSGFDIDNPNATNTCGCGSSFG